MIFTTCFYALSGFLLAWIIELRRARRPTQRETAQQAELDESGFG